MQAQNTITYLCILRSNAQHDTLCDGRVMPIYGIASTLSGATRVPAKILYCNEGDSVVLNTKSISQGEHHTIHLHGLDVDTRNDGDPSTSFWLRHQQDTTYSFKAKHAGTYLYHCHVADVIHVQMGMYGLIVVRSANAVKTAWTGGPAFDKDYKWLTSEIDSVWHYHIPPHDTILDTVHVPKYIPNYFLINGKCGSELSSDDSIQIKAAQGEKILMRTGNIGYLANRMIFPPWLNAQIIDSDGRPLPSAIINDTCYMMPGERFSILLQSNIQATATVKVDYIDMNTGGTVFTNNVPVIIKDYVGIKENANDKNALMIYPNPVESELHISSMKDVEQIQIFNCIGQQVMATEASDAINVSRLAPGIYVVHAVSRDNTMLFGKFVKQ